MTAEIEHISLEQVRRIRGTVDAIRVDVVDMKLRMSAHEAHTGQMQMKLAGWNGRKDRFDERMMRVESTLDIVDA